MSRRMRQKGEWMKGSERMGRREGDKQRVVGWQVTGGVVLLPNPVKQLPGSIFPQLAHHVKLHLKVICSDTVAE